MKRLASFIDRVARPPAGGSMCSFSTSVLMNSYCLSLAVRGGCFVVAMSMKALSVRAEVSASSGNGAQRKPTDIAAAFGFQQVNLCVSKAKANRLGMGLLAGLKPVQQLAQDAARAIS